MGSTPYETQSLRRTGISSISAKDTPILHVGDIRCENVSMARIAKLAVFSRDGVNSRAQRSPKAVSVRTEE